MTLVDYYSKSHGVSLHSAEETLRHSLQRAGEKAAEDDAMT
jgi:hypothetical protein